MSPNLAIGWQNLVFLLLGSALFPLINLLAFRANRDVDAGLFTILNNITPIITIVIASLLLNETLNDQQLLGAVLIIASTFLATLPALHRNAGGTSTGIVLAIASVSLLGLAIVFERWMLTRIDLGAYLVFGWGAQALWMGIIAWPVRKEVNILLNKKHFLPVAAYGFFSACKGLCFVSALKVGGNASVVSASASFVAVMVVIAAYVVLKERRWLWFKISAAIIGTAGLLILNTI